MSFFVGGSFFGFAVVTALDDDGGTASDGVGAPERSEDESADGCFVCDVGNLIHGGRVWVVVGVVRSY